MNLVNQILLSSVALVYSSAVALRHRLFEWGFLKSVEFDIPIVCVGNLTMGGTGKTPTTEYLVGLLGGQYHVAVLSRGYKRRTKGFVLATTTSSYRTIGDEPKQIKLKFPEMPVAVCEKRVEGIKMLRKAHPEVNLIILDDAFQHRYVEPWVNILLMDYNRPIYQDKMFPLGGLRDLPYQIERAQFVLTTKCSADISPLEMRLVHTDLALLPYQRLYFTRFESGEPRALFPELVTSPMVKNVPVVIMSAIAQPNGFINHVACMHPIVHTLLFADHHSLKMRDIRELEALLKNSPRNTVVMMTEKDAVKLLNTKKVSLALKSRLYYIPIALKFIDEASEVNFSRQLCEYVRE
ncbi:MAG: tetraacyldisaccharide 4'-kinase, partial [Mucinivorans sp.]